MTDCRWKLSAQICKISGVTGKYWDELFSIHVTCYRGRVAAHVCLICNKMGLWNIKRHDKGQWVRRGAILGKGNCPWCLVMLVSMGGWCLEALSRGGDCQSNRSKVSRWVAELWPRMETGVGAEEMMGAQGKVQHNRRDCDRRNRARGHKGSLQRAKILILPELQIKGAISAKTHSPAA